MEPAGTFNFSVGYRMSTCERGKMIAYIGENPENNFNPEIITAFVDQVIAADLYAKLTGSTFPNDTVASL
jgi:hypothetical protein